MAQDIREMFRNEKGSSQDKLSKGHQNRFAEKLEEALPKKKSRSSFRLMKIAAVLIVALGAGLYFFAPPAFSPEDQVVNVPVTEKEKEPAEEEQFKLSKVSPQFRKIENYYLASLNIELAKLEITDENRELIDSFMGQLSILEKEYHRLNKEFGETGANEQTVQAMIKNLQLRLELLFKLKNKIREIKNSELENYENAQA